jgi:hypothetical protein
MPVVFSCLSPDAQEPFLGFIRSIKRLGNEERYPVVTEKEITQWMETEHHTVPLQNKACAYAMIQRILQYSDNDLYNISPEEFRGLMGFVAIIKPKERSFPLSSHTERCGFSFSHGMSTMILC